MLQAMREGASVPHGSWRAAFMLPHTWDQEMMRLHHEIEALKRENAALRGMLQTLSASATPRSRRKMRGSGRQSLLMLRL